MMKYKMQKIWAPYFSQFHL